MDKKTRDKINLAVCDFVNKVIRIADEDNYDRDSLMEATADMLGAMVGISTFKNFNAD